MISQIGFGRNLWREQWSCIDVLLIEALMSLCIEHYKQAAVLSHGLACEN